MICQENTEFVPVWRATNTTWVIRVFLAAEWINLANGLAAVLIVAVTTAAQAVRIVAFKAIARKWMATLEIRADLIFAAVGSNTAPRIFFVDGHRFAIALRQCLTALVKAACAVVVTWNLRIAHSTVALIDTTGLVAQLLGDDHTRNRAVVTSQGHTACADVVAAVGSFVHRFE